MARYRLAPLAAADIAGILQWSRARFGAATARRYGALLVAAMRDVASDPNRPGSTTQPELSRGARSWHVRLSRSHSTAGAVQHPRHVVIYRADGDGVVILRVLHDSMDLPRHLDPTPDSEAQGSGPVARPA